MKINDNSAVHASMQKAGGTDGQARTGQLEKTASIEEQKGSSPKAAEAPAKVAMDAKAMQEAVEKLSEFIDVVSNRGLEISVDKELSQVVLKVVNRDNEEMIRQIPSEEVLELMKRMKDLSEEFFGDATGLLVHNKV
jgi:flagellar protein FlaG